MAAVSTPPTNSALARPRLLAIVLASLRRTPPDRRSDSRGGVKGRAATSMPGGTEGKREVTCRFVQSFAAPGVTVHTFIDFTVAPRPREYTPTPRLSGRVG